MIFHRRIRVRHGDLIESGIFGFFKGPEKKFEVHHVVDDGRVYPLIPTMVPRANYPGVWIKSFDVGPRGLD